MAITQGCFKLYWTNPGGNTPQQVYSHLPPITKTIQIRRTRHTGLCWRSKGKLMTNILPRTPSHGQPARTCLHQLCSLEDLLGVMVDRDWW